MSHDVGDLGRRQHTGAGKPKPPVGTQQPQHVQLRDDAEEGFSVLDDRKRVEVVPIEQGHEFPDRRLRGHRDRRTGHDFEDRRGHHVGLHPSSSSFRAKNCSRSLSVTMPTSRLPSTTMSRDWPERRITAIASRASVSGPMVLSDPQGARSEPTVRRVHSARGTLLTCWAVTQPSSVPSSTTGNRVWWYL